MDKVGRRRISRREAPLPPPNAAPPAETPANTLSVFYAGCDSFEGRDLIGGIRAFF